MLDEWDASEDMTVTPCVGVWIETVYEGTNDGGKWSHPAWVCGLKQHHYMAEPAAFRHTLRGCVD